MTEDGEKKENGINERKDSKISQGTNMNTDNKTDDTDTWFYKLCNKWKINTNLIMLKVTLFVLYGGESFYFLSYIQTIGTYTATEKYSKKKTNSNILLN